MQVNPSVFYLVSAAMSICVVRETRSCSVRQGRGRSECFARRRNGDLRPRLHRRVAQAVRASTLSGGGCKVRWFKSSRAY